MKLLLRGREVGDERGKAGKNKRNDLMNNILLRVYLSGVQNCKFRSTGLCLNYLMKGCESCVKLREINFCVSKP